MSQSVSVTSLQKLVDAGQITPQDIAAKVKSGEIELHDDRAPATSAPKVAAPEEPSIGGFVSNAVSSAGKVASDIGTAVSGLSPISSSGELRMPPTQKAVITTGIGAVQKATTALGASSPTERGLTDYRGNADAIMKSFGDRYGNWQNIKKTAYEDPVGFLLDASAVLTGGSTAADRLGMSTAAKVLKVAGEVTDPIRAATSAATGAVKTVAKVAEPIIGKMTGTGAETLQRAAKGSDAFAEAMRNGDDGQIVKDLKDSVEKLTEQRHADYQQQLSRLPPAQLNVQPVVAELRNQLSNFGVKVKQVGGKFVADFSNSKIIDAAQQQAVQEVMDDVAARMNKPMSVGDMDTLKQRTSQRLGTGSQADRIIGAAKDAATGTLNQVPGYEDMTRSYAEASTLLDKIKTEFSATGSTGKEGTTLRKLQNALNQRSDFRKTLLDLVDQETGSKIGDSLAGSDMSSWMPRGLMGPLLGAGALVNPKVLLGLAASSPRFVGEALLAISKARRAAGALPSTVAPVVAPVRDVMASSSIQ